MPDFLKTVGAASWVVTADKQPKGTVPLSADLFANDEELEGIVPELGSWDVTRDGGSVLIESSIDRVVSIAGDVKDAKKSKFVAGKAKKLKLTENESVVIIDGEEYEVPA